MWLPIADQTTNNPILPLDSMVHAQSEEKNTIFEMDDPVPSEHPNFVSDWSLAQENNDLISACSQFV